MRPSLLLGFALAACARTSPPRSPASVPAATGRASTDAEITLRSNVPEIREEGMALWLASDRIGALRGRLRAVLDGRQRVLDSAFDDAYLAHFWAERGRFVFMARDGALYLTTDFLGPLRPIGRVDPERFNPVLRGRFAVMEPTQIKVLGDDSLVAVPLPPEALGEEGRGAAREAWFSTPESGGAMLEDGSVWRTEDAGAHWTRTPFTTLPPVQALTSAGQLRSDDLDRRYLRALVTHDPQIALFLGGMRSAEGDYVLRLDEREVLTLRPDGALGARLSLPEGVCILRPWGDALAFVCRMETRSPNLWRLRHGALTRVAPNLSLVQPSFGDDGVHFFNQGRVCNADTGDCWRCAPGSATRLHGAVQYRSLVGSIFRCDRDGETLVRPPGAIARCERVALLTNHPDGVVAVFTECRDEHALRSPDQLLLLGDSAAEPLALPFRALGLLALDAQHFVAANDDGAIFFSEDGGRSWSQHPDPTLANGAVARLAARCNGGACVVDGLGLLTLTRDPGRSVEPPAHAQRSDDLGEWLNAGAMSCRVDTPLQGVASTELDAWRSDRAALWWDHSALRWRTAEGTGVAPRAHAMSPEFTIVPLAATTTDLWFSSQQQGSTQHAATRTVFHADAQGVRAVDAQAAAAMLVDSAISASGDLMQLLGGDPNETQIVTLSARRRPPERRTLPTHTALEDVYPGALGDRPAAVRVTFFDGALRVTAHTVTGPTDRSWRGAFARQATTPWCDAPPTLWWEQPVSEFAAVSFSAGVSVAGSQSVRVGVLAGRLCLDGWRGHPRFGSVVAVPPSAADLARPFSEIATSFARVSRTPQGWVGHGTAALGGRLFDLPLRCATSARGGFPRS